MKKIEVIERFAKEVINKGQTGNELYSCFYSFVEQLRAKGLIKKSEVFTAAALPEKLAKLGW